MNWVGGARKRTGGPMRNDRKLQKEFFERKRLNALSVQTKQPATKSKNRKGGHGKKHSVSQDILAFQLARKVTSEPKEPSKFRVLDLGSKRTVPGISCTIGGRAINNVELPASPLESPSALNLSGSSLRTSPEERSRTCGGQSTAAADNVENKSLTTGSSCDVRSRVEQLLFQSNSVRLHYSDEEPDGKKNINKFFMDLFGEQMQKPSRETAMSHGDHLRPPPHEPMHQVTGSRVSRQPLRYQHMQRGLNPDSDVRYFHFNSRPGRVENRSLSLSEDFRRHIRPEIDEPTDFNPQCMSTPTVGPPSSSSRRRASFAPYKTMATTSPPWQRGSCGVESTPLSRLDFRDDDETESQVSDDCTSYHSLSYGASKFHDRGENELTFYHRTVRRDAQSYLSGEESIDSGHGNRWGRCKSPNIRFLQQFESDAYNTRKESHETSRPRTSRKYSCNGHEGLLLSNWRDVGVRHDGFPKAQRNIYEHQDELISATPFDNEQSGQLGCLIPVGTRSQHTEFSERHIVPGYTCNRISEKAKTYVVLNEHLGEYRISNSGLVSSSPTMPTHCVPQSKQEDPTTSCQSLASDKECSPRIVPTCTELSYGPLHSHSKEMAMQSQLNPQLRPVASHIEWQRGKLKRANETIRKRFVQPRPGDAMRPVITCSQYTTINSEETMAKETASSSVILNTRGQHNDRQLTPGHQSYDRNDKTGSRSRSILSKRQNGSSSEEVFNEICLLEDQDSVRAASPLRSAKACGLKSESPKIYYRFNTQTMNKVNASGVDAVPVEVCDLMNQMLDFVQMERRIYPEARDLPRWRGYKARFTGDSSVRSPAKCCSSGKTSLLECRNEGGEKDVKKGGSDSWHFSSERRPEICSSEYEHRFLSTNANSSATPGEETHSDPREETSQCFYPSEETSQSLPTVEVTSSESQTSPAQLVDASCSPIRFHFQDRHRISMIRKMPCLSGTDRSHSNTRAGSTHEKNRVRNSKKQGRGEQSNSKEISRKVNDSGSLSAEREDLLVRMQEE